MPVEKANNIGSFFTIWGKLAIGLFAVVIAAYTTYMSVGDNSAAIEKEINDRKMWEKQLTIKIKEVEKKVVDMFKDRDMTTERRYNQAMKVAEELHDYHHELTDKIDELEKEFYFLKGRFQAR